MKIISWNVNGIRAIAKKGFLEWLKEESPDILCLQETKCRPQQLGPDLLTEHGYQTYWSSAEKKGYSGVSIFTKTPPVQVKEGIGAPEFDSEGRTLQADFKDFTLFNVYFPNGGAGNKRVPFKMAFYEQFLKTADKLRKSGRDLIICGDVNTAHTEIDLARPKQNEKNTGFLPEEREWISKFLKRGYADTFRLFTKEGGHYTWWDYKTGARQRDVGWRIDYFFVSENAISRVKQSYMLKNIYGSDHCPIVLNWK